MPTSRWCAKFGIPERTWRRWQARARREQPTRGAWPQPARMPVRELVLQHALAHPAWGHRKIWAMVRHEGRLVSQSTVLRIPREEGLILSPRYQAERRQLAAARKAAFADPPTAPNHVWQLDFTEVETTRGGTWRIAACRDYWSKYELGWHIGQVPASGVALCSFAGGSGSECWQLVGSDLGVGGGDGVDAAVRRRISRLSRSAGLLDQIWVHTSLGNSVKARMSARAWSRWSWTCGSFSAT